MPITTSNLIKERLLIINPEYTQAMQTGRSTRFIPKMLPLFSAPIYMKKKKTHLDQVAIARAPKVFVPQGVRAYYPNETDKHKQHPEYIFTTFNGELRQEQVDIVDKLLKHRYAFGHISTGVGKTYIQCEIIRRLKRKTLIVVDTTSALSQMEKQIKTILDIDVCLPNKKKHQDSPITVWNIHSLHKLDLQSYGLVLYDEADTFLGSENYRHTINQIDSEYAYAVTGTIKVNHYPDNIFNIFY